jgi:hypothetical protein
MAKITDGTFKNWQDTEIIHASEYTQEREILRVAVNDNDTRIGSLESSTIGLQLGTAQLQKITNDLGGVKLSISSTSGDILDTIKNEGVGLHTFYAVSGSKNLPPSNKSIRGIASITSINPTHGWVWATDYDNTFFHNYIANDIWQGWGGPTVQKELWSGGATGSFMKEGQTVTPSKKLTDCRNGWILVWSDYDDATNKANNYDFHYSYVPKFIATKHDGAGHLFSVPYSPSGIIEKFVNVSDTKLEGNAGNDLDSDKDVVLRYVVEW